MAMELRIPDLGESVSEVQIGEWRRSQGDRVQKDEVLVVVESDKASMEIPAPADGMLGEIIKGEGESAGVGEVIGSIEEAGEGESAEGKGAAGDGEEERAEAGEETGGRGRETRKQEKAHAERAGTERPAGTQERGAGERSSAPRARPGKEAGGRTGETPREGRSVEGRAPTMTPAARRLVREHDLDPVLIDSGRREGHLYKEDVLRHLEGRESGDGRGTPEEQAQAPRQEAAEAPGADRNERRMPMTALRRRIAERLVQAQQQAALLTTFNEIDMSAVKGLRRRHRRAFQERYGVDLGFMPFFVKAVVEALKDVPELNAVVDGTDVVYRDYYHIGIAVGGGKGLVVPVLRDADRMSFAGISGAVDDFARRAREETLRPDELQGGTFTISNGGVYGSLLSTPIVNPPQSGVLGMHVIQDRPVAREGMVEVRPMMYVALTYDHRLVDGREAVTFLRRIKECVEDPQRVMLEV